MRASTQEILLEDVAANLSPHFQPFLHPLPKYAELQELAQTAAAANPSLELYLLSGTGEILWSFSTRGVVVVEHTLSLEPIQRFLALRGPNDGSILGPDPAKRGRGVPFSAAPILLGGQQGFLYVILDSSSQHELLSFRLGEMSVQAILRYLVLAGLLAAFVGMRILGYLMKRIRRLDAVLSDISRGDYSRRLSDETDDQLGALSRAIDSMAEKIESNVLQLEHRDRIRRELVADIAHDLRGPLSHAKAHLELAEGDLSRGTLRRESLSRSLTALERLLQELLELSRLEATERAPEMVLFEVEEILSESKSLTEVLAKDSGVVLELSCEGSNLIAHGDVGMILRVLGNLIENAVRYSNPGGHIWVCASEVGNRIRFSVNDEGPGIEANDINKILSRYGRGEGRSGEQQGSFGLGLAIVKRILELHDTSIHIQSELGKGSSFFFFLPTAIAKNLVHEQ